MGPGQSESITPHTTGNPGPGAAASPALHSELQPDEIRSVLDRYELGEICHVSALRAGSTLSPKAIIESERGKFLLKRRARGVDIPTVVAFSHEILNGCLRAGVCVPPLVGSKEGNNSIVQMHDHVYELFVYIQGIGYAQTNGQSFQSGALLAETHRAMDTIRCTFDPSIEPVVVDPARARCLSPVDGFDQRAIDQSIRILEYGMELVRANAEPPSIVHGDWHPGNMIYQRDEIIAVCDFDNTRAGSRRRELAQALVHFSIQDGSAASPERGLLGAFAAGYRSVNPGGIDGRVIASLMPAVLLDEALASITPSELSAYAMKLGAVLLRAAWMDDHHRELTGMLTHD